MRRDWIVLLIIRSVIFITQYIIFIVYDFYTQYTYIMLPYRHRRWWWRVVMFHSEVNEKIKKIMKEKKNGEKKRRREWKKVRALYVRASVFWLKFCSPFVGGNFIRVISTPLISSILIYVAECLRVVKWFLANFGAAYSTWIYNYTYVICTCMYNMCVCVFGFTYCCRRKERKIFWNSSSTKKKKKEKKRNRKEKRKQGEFEKTRWLGITKWNLVIPAPQPTLRAFVNHPPADCSSWMCCSRIHSRTSSLECFINKKKAFTRLSAYWYLVCG